MIATIAKRFTFDAAHHLPSLPADHKCHRMHGHTYEVELVLVGPVNEHGFVVDYAELEKAWRSISDLVDHRVLNEVKGLETPSTEVLAAWIGSRLCEHIAFRGPNYVLGKAEYSTTLLACIRVKESSTTWCEVLVNHIDGAPFCWISVHGNPG